MSSKRLEMFDKLIAGGSKDPFHYYGRAMELRSLGHKADALEAFVGLTASSPDYVPTYWRAAPRAHDLGQPERARELAQAGVQQAARAGNDHAKSELEELLASL